jgi:hypothetical protein
MIARAELQARQPAGADLVAVPAQLSELADRQAGILTRRQMSRAGLTAHDIETGVRVRRWRTFGRNVVALQNAPLTPVQREWVAVLFPGKPAALAGLSAAAAAGLRGFVPERTHIVVAHATEVHAPAWVKVHESRRFAPEDINPAAAPPRTRAGRSVVDAAAWSRSPRRACAILCAAVQQRLVTAEQLREELSAAGRVRHVAIMRQVLCDIAGGAHTLAEIDLDPLARAAGLAPPRRQRFRREAGGKVRWLDAEFDLPDGTRLAVEIDGRGHLEVENWLDDTDRDNEVVIDGRAVLRFPSITVRLNRPRVIDQLRRIRLAHTPPRNDVVPASSARVRRKPGQLGSASGYR